MYAVIFRAKIALLDDETSALAVRLRQLAMDQYGCLEFVAVTEGDEEIAISYWESEAQIKAWKNDAEHLIAQRKGRQRWYESYHVQVMKVIREYRNRSAVSKD